jgi:hypothetical protein
MDQYLEELHELWLANEPPTAEMEEEMTRRHGMVPEA